MIPCICKDIAKQSKNYTDNCFCKLWLFEHFSDNDFELLKSIGKQKIIPKNHYVFHQGAPADKIFLLKSGRVKLTKALEDGTEVILDFRQKGEIFGENAFMDDSLLPMSAIALEETIICGATKADLEKVILQNPHIGLIMMKNMSKKIDVLTSRLENISIGTLEERLYQTLLSIAKEQGTTSQDGCRIGFPLTHEDLSFLIKGHRVSITKSLQNLVKTGRVKREGKYFTIPL